MSLPLVSVTHSNKNTKVEISHTLAVRCSPHDRDWENSQQKCDYCDIHNLSCGPNLKYNDDPVFIQKCSHCDTHNLPCGPNVKYDNDPEFVSRRQRAAGNNQAREPPSGHLDESATSSAQKTPAPITRRRERERNDISPNPYEIRNGSSVKDL